MGKIKVLLLSIHYPFAIKNYFESALQDRDDIDLRTTGPYTGTYIPWLSGMNLPVKYAVSPTYPLAFKPNVGRVSYDLVKAQIQDDWTPDIVLCVDAGINWSSKPSDGIVVTVGTDSHCLDYDYARNISDRFFNMHWRYMKPGDRDLPYAFSTQYMYPMPEVEKDSDAVLIGMPYPQRISWVESLRDRGVSVLFENGPILDEYRLLNNRAQIGLNWSSLQDLNCRVFELMGMKLCPVINHVPDLDRLGFVDGVHYLGFDGTQHLSGVGEATEKVLWAKEHEAERNTIAKMAYDKVIEEDHTFDNRVRTILKECKVI